MFNSFQIWQNSKLALINSLFPYLVTLFYSFKKVKKRDYDWTTFFTMGMFIQFCKSKLNKVEDKDFFVSFIAVWYIQKFPGLLINSRTVWSTKNTHTRIPPAMAFDGFIQHFFNGASPDAYQFFFKFLLKL